MADSLLRRGTRGLLKTVAVLIGLAFVVVGGLGSVMGVQKFVAAGHQPGPPEFDTATQVVGIGIFFAVALFGAFLIWLGVRRPTSRAAIDLADARSAAARAHDTDGARQGLPLGRLIAECGPQKSGQVHYVVCGIGMLVFAAVCYVAPSTFLHPKPGDEKAVLMVSWLTTVVSVVFGLVMVCGPLFFSNQKISLYEGGLLEQVGSSERQIAFDQIQHLRLQEWYEHRFAPRTFNVKATVAGQKDLSFSSALRGDAETIVTYLAQRVASVETVPFVA